MKPTKKRRGRTPDIRRRAAAWLKSYLEGRGEVPADEVLHAGRDEGFSISTLKNAKKDVGAFSYNLWYWTIPDKESNQ